MMDKGELGEHLGEQKAAKQPRDIGKIIRFSLSGVAFLFLVLFIAFNTNEVEVSFVVWSGQVALIWVIVISAILGAVSFGVVRAILNRRRYRR